MLPDHGGHLDAWLKECLGSATSITGIFDLFRRTFGDSRIVLSQAYCVYTAASVFLLKIQATMDSRPIVLARLAFCVDVLAKIKSSTPGKIRQSEPDEVTDLTTLQSFQMQSRSF